MVYLEKKIVNFKGLRRDQNWVGKLTEDERSVILQGVLNTDLIQNELLLAEPTPEAPKAAEPAEGMVSSDQKALTKYSQIFKHQNDCIARGFNSFYDARIQLFAEK